MTVFQTAGAPPSSGSSCLPTRGWMEKRRVALRKMVPANTAVSSGAVCFLFCGGFSTQSNDRFEDHFPIYFGAGGGLHQIVQSARNGGSEDDCFARTGCAKDFRLAN